MPQTRSIEPITVVKTRCAELIERARDSGRPIVITQNGRATAVLQDVDSFERQRKALLLLRFIAQGERELRQGRGIAHAEAAARIRRATRELG